ncbi:hatching enzyme 1.2 isoform X1 [Bemisia tabaci]|uniref:hatching enzyme 1.2 isoform X1 n=1 Tax=Bemisia tabaci TaxID=7038 RepID=UPI003B28D88B
MIKPTHRPRKSHLGEGFFKYAVHYSGVFWLKTKRTCAAKCARKKKTMGSWLISLAAMLLNASKPILPPRTSTSNESESDPCKRFTRADVAGQMLTVRESRIDQWTPESAGNIWEMSGLFEGDIMVDPKDLTRNAVNNTSKRWPKAIVPYAFHPDFPKEGRDMVLKGMSELEAVTCVRFKAYQPEAHDSWVEIQGPNNTRRCSSAVGRRGGKQKLMLAPRCYAHGSVVIQHELLHALGFYHQHSAIERDRYVSIRWKNIDKASVGNFCSRTTENFGVDYDYASIMHYSPVAFTTNGEETIVPLKRDQKAQAMGQRQKLSAEDILKVQKMYSCQT